MIESMEIDQETTRGLSIGTMTFDLNRGLIRKAFESYDLNGHRRP